MATVCRKTDYWEAMILRRCFGGAALTIPGIWYLALCTTEPDDDTAGTPLAASDYARIPVNNGTVYWSPDPSTDGYTKNIRNILSRTTKSDWTGITHGELWDALSGGNRCYYGPFVDGVGSPTTINVPLGYRLRLKPGMLKVKED